MFSGSSEAGVGLIDQCPQSPPTRGSGEKILLLRLNLAHGADVVSQADVLIVAGTTANVVVPTKLGQLQYHIVTSAVDPMRLRVQVQVAGEGGTGNAAGPNQSPAGMATAVLGTSLQLEPYHGANAGRLFVDREAFDLQVAAAAAPTCRDDRGGLRTLLPRRPHAIQILRSFQIQTPLGDCGGSMVRVGQFIHRQHLERRAGFDHITPARAGEE